MMELWVLLELTSASNIVLMVYRADMIIKHSQHYFFLDGGLMDNWDEVLSAEPIVLGLWCGAL